MGGRIKQQGLALLSCQNRGDPPTSTTRRCRWSSQEELKTSLRLFLRLKPLFCDKRHPNCDAGQLHRVDASCRAATICTTCNKEAPDPWTVPAWMPAPSSMGKRWPGLQSSWGASSPPTWARADLSSPQLFSNPVWSCHMTSMLCTSVLFTELLLPKPTSSFKLLPAGRG